MAHLNSNPVVLGVSLAMGSLGELYGFVTSNSFVQGMSAIGVISTAAATWYWSQKDNKRRADDKAADARRRNRLLDAATDERLRAMEQGKADPNPEITKILLEDPDRRHGD